MGAPTGILFSLLDEDARPIACRPVECGGESLIEAIEQRALLSGEGGIAGNRAE